MVSATLAVHRPRQFIGFDKQNNQRKIVSIFYPYFSIYLGCSKEPPNLDESYKYPQYMFWLRNKKKCFCYALLTKGMLASSRFCYNQIIILYPQLVICSCDTETSEKNNFIFVSEKCKWTVLREQMTLNIIDTKCFSHQSIKRSNMLEKYCHAVSFEKELL